MPRQVPSLRALAGISRAPFLLLPVALIGTTTSIAYCTSTIQSIDVILALIGLLSLHIAVDSINEAGDAQSGIDDKTERTPFSGGSGTIQKGDISIRFAYIWGLTFAGLGAAIGVWFLYTKGTILLPIFLAGAVCVLTYTHWLLRTGLGEVFAGLGLGALPVLGGSLVLSGEIPNAALACATLAFFMTFNLLLLAEFPDTVADRIGGRKHLVILLGARTSGGIYMLAGLGVPFSLGVSILIGALPVLTILAAIPTLLLLPAFRTLLKPTNRGIPIAALAGNVFWNLSTHVVLMITIWISCKFI